MRGWSEMKLTRIESTDVEVFLKDAFILSDAFRFDTDNYTYTARISFGIEPTNFIELLEKPKGKPKTEPEPQNDEAKEYKPQSWMEEGNDEKRN